MNIAHRDQLLEHLKSKINSIDLDMKTIEKTFKQKGGNKYVQMAYPTFKGYQKEKDGGQKRELAAMHTIVEYLDQQMNNSNDPQFLKRGRFGKRRVLEQIRENKK